MRFFYFACMLTTFLVGGSQAKSLQVETFSLKGEFLAAAIHESGAQTRLAAFSSVTDRNELQIEWFSGIGENKIQVAGIQQLWNDTAGYDICRFKHSDNHSNLLFLRPDGVYRLGSSAPLVRTETIYAHPQRSRLTRVPICFAFGKDGQAALIVPVFKGMELWVQHRPGDFRLATMIPVEARMNMFERSFNVAGASQSQKVQFSMEYPEVIVADFDGNSRKDICMSLEDGLRCYFQKEDGTFDEKESVFYDFTLKLPDEGSSVRYLTKLVDLNNNGRKDVVVTRQKFDLTNMVGSVSVFMQNEARQFTTEPQLILSRSGFFAFQEFVDLSGDGYLDLVAPTVELGWTALAGIFLRRSATIQFVSYRNRNGELSDTATNLHSMSYPVEFRNFASFLGALPDWNVSFLRDVDERQIMFFPGRSQIEIYTFDNERFRVGRRLIRESIDLGSYARMLHLADADNSRVLLIAEPFDNERSRQIQLVYPPSAAAN